MNWIPLTTAQQLNELLNDSTIKPALIFKHSTRCGISRMALKNFERSFNFTEDEISAYYLDLLNFRDISKAIADKLHVFHQSPQLIVLKNGEVIHHSSHGDIDADNVSSILK